jgi:succinate dehydrogenase / fumarate reductase cytochrome b subunit
LVYQACAIAPSIRAFAGHIDNCGACCSALKAEHPAARDDVASGDQARWPRPDRRSSVRSLRIFPSIAADQHGDVDPASAHRAALYFGTLLLAAWLIAAAMGEAQFDSSTPLRASDRQARPLRLHLGLCHHMLGGMRHLIWDTGRGFQIWQINALSLADDHRLRRPDLAIWTVGLMLRGGL